MGRWAWSYLQLRSNVMFHLYPCVVNFYHTVTYNSTFVTVVLNQQQKKWTMVIFLFVDEFAEHFPQIFPLSALRSVCIILNGSKLHLETAWDLLRHPGYWLVQLDQSLVISYPKYCVLTSSSSVWSVLAYAVFLKAFVKIRESAFVFWGTDLCRRPNFWSWNAVL